MDELQTWWEVPCIGQFVSLFRFVFSLPELDIEDIEKAFIADGTKEGSPCMQNLLISLIRGFYSCKSISLDNWESYFHRILNRYWCKRDRRTNPLSDTIGFSQLKLRTKVELVYHLCLYRLERNDVMHVMKSMDADALRVQSLGTDSQGNVYWYFYGTRLYKEAPSPAKSLNKKKNFISSQVPLKRGRGRPRKIKPTKSDGESDELEDSDGSKKYLTLDSKSRWSVVCTTLADWKAFAAKFKSSKVKCEADLFQLVKNNFLPVLTEMYEKKKEKEKAQAKEALTSDRSLSRTGRKTKSADDTSSAEKPVNKSKQRKRRQNQSTSLDRKTRRIEEQNFTELVETSKTVATAVTTVTTTTATSTCVPCDNYVIDKNLSYEPELVLKLRKVLSSVKLHKDAWPFLYSVDELVAPGYYDVVKEPVDLSSIERKIELKAYSNLAQIEADFQKLVSNCSLYNGEKSTYTSMAKSLWRVFRKGISELLLTPDPSAESDAPKGKESVKDTSLSDAKSTSVSKSQQRPKSALKGKKRTRSQTMAGLEMLAEASELALKDVGKTEGELFVVDAPGIPLKSKAFPDLKIVTIQNHPPSFIAKCKRSSTSSRESVDSDTSLRDSVSPVSTNSQCSDDSAHSKSSKSEGRGRKKVRLSLTTKSSNIEAEESCISEKPVSPDSCNIIGIGMSTRSSDRLSNSGSGQSSPKSLQDFAETIHFLDVPGDISKTDTLTNLSSLLCRIMKENQVSDSQNLLYVGNSDSNLSEDNFEPPKLERVSENNASDKSFSEPRSPRSSPSISVHEDKSILPPKLDSRSDFMGLKPIDNITTVDASAIGISTINSSGSNDIDTVQQDSVYSSKESVSNSQKASVEADNIPENVAFTTELSPVLYSSHEEVKTDAQNSPEMPLSSREKTDINIENCGVNAPDSNLLQQNLAFHIPFTNGTLNPSPNSDEAVSYSGQNAYRISPPMAVGSLNYFPEFLLPRLPMSLPEQSPSQLPISTSSSFLGNQGSKLSVSLPPMTIPGPPVSFMPANGALSSSSSSSLSYGASTSASSYIPESQLYAKLPTSSFLVNGDNRKIAIKPANSVFKNGTKKDSSPRRIKKKKRSVIVSQNQQNNLVIESNITKTVHATVAETSEIESVPEQFIAAENSALYKLTNLVSHSRNSDVEKEARYLSVSPTSRMENNSKISSSSMFVPYTTSIDTTKCGVPQVPSFWNGKEKSFCNMPSTHAMTYPLFPPPHPPISTCAPMSTFCNNNSYYVNNSINKSQTLVHCVPSSQPAFFDPSLSSVDSPKTHLSIPVSCSGNILPSVQPVNSNSPQQVPDSRTVSPENQKDFVGLLPQKLTDGVYHTYGIQSAQPLSNVPTQQIMPQSFVTLPPSSYILPVQPPMSSMMPHSMLQNFVMNSKPVDASLSTFNEIRPQFSTNRTMPVYTILQNMPAKIVQ